VASKFVKRKLCPKQKQNNNKRMGNSNSTSRSKNNSSYRNSRIITLPPILKIVVVLPI
jgi:hypothetical protein